MNNFVDLAHRAYKNNRYYFTDFLTLSEYGELEDLSNSFDGIPFDAFGGYEGAERVMVRFGNENLFGYEENFPIAILHIRLANKKYATACTHRDYLGSLMGLGLLRKCFGDILCDETGAYVFVQEKNLDYVLQNLTSVGKNTVIMQVLSELPENLLREHTKEISVQAASMRIDGIAAHVFHLSRKDIVPYFFEKKVAVNGRIVENNDRQLKEGDLVSVRGYGKFRVKETGGLSRKGKLNLRIDLFI